VLEKNEMIKWKSWFTPEGLQAIIVPARLKERKKGVLEQKPPRSVLFAGR